MKMSSLFILSALLLFVLFSCKENPVSSEEQNPLDFERQQIVDTYRSWSAKLIAQDFAGAMSHCAPGSNCEGRTRVHKETWDMGGQSYDDFTYVEAWLSDDDLLRGYGEAVGNTTYYQFVPSHGDVRYEEGFYSSTRKIEGRWKIDGINSNLAPNWWK